MRVTGSTFAEDFAPTGMPKAVAAFAVCARDLAKRSGVDLVLRDAVAVKAQPVGEVGALFGMNNYPSEARRLNQSGRASVLLTIEADGQVSVCRVTQSSESASLDKTTCDLFLHRSRFKPALDKAGKPMKSQFVTAIRWQLDS